MQSNQVLRILMGFAAVVVVIAGLKAAATLLIPFLLACFISILCIPPMLWMTEHRVPVWLSVTLIVLILLGILLVSGSLLNASTMELRDNIPLYLNTLNQQLSHVGQRLSGLGLELDGGLSGIIDPSNAIPWIGDILSSLRAALINLIIIIFVVAFVLLEANTFARKNAASLRQRWQYGLQ